ncbi:MAG: hypothetical protein KAI81_05560, partial [Candidatus Marinimicrobia bacterium]|nr:hypothetical protein [Candidatus Neomarinimicrobiota bacterium]
MEYPIVPDDHLVVVTDKGEDMGRVTAVLEKLCEDCPETSDFKIARKASELDWQTYRENQEKEKEAIHICRRLVDDLGLTMKLMDVEYQLDRKKVTFFYTADDRVDFRELVRVLAGTFRTRIEMRQIGVRDEAKRLRTIGTCGLPLCCGEFIEHFEPVNTQYAKDQGLPMNPTKLSGQCGKLKCCLRFEHASYKETLNAFPISGEPVFFNNKKGYIDKINVIRQVAMCNMEDNTQEEFSKETSFELVKIARD